MRLFVATETLDEEDDFSFTVPGELVHFPPVICDCPGCGCEVSMAGFVSHRATTSFVVRDLDLDVDTFTELLFETLRDGGWVTSGSTDDRDWVRNWAVEHIEAAADIPTETPLRVQGGQVTTRRANRAS